MCVFIVLFLLIDHVVGDNIVTGSLSILACLGNITGYRGEYIAVMFSAILVHH